MLCGPARGDLDEPGRAVAVKFNFSRPIFSSSPVESESEPPEARGDIKDEAEEGDTGQRQEWSSGGHETACEGCEIECGVNRRAAACWF